MWFGSPLYLITFFFAIIYFGKKNIMNCVFVYNLFSLFQDVVTTSKPIVTIPLGKIEGYQTKTVNGREYIAFEGIPYAQPPTGQRRFAVRFVC